MRAAGVADVGVREFARLYELLLRGDRGVLSSDELEPVRDVPWLGDLDAGDAPLERTVMIRLNGGLGHDDGALGPEVPRRGQARSHVPRRDRAPGACGAGARLPLVLMNSFATREPSLAALAPLRRPGR